MPFVPNTPEAHTALTNPANGSIICRGVSNDGKPCKRALTRSRTGEPTSGIITIVNKREAYFCSRHQDQAKDVVLRHTASFARRRELVGRGSMDTLIEEVELLVAGGDAATTTTKVVSTTKKLPKDRDPFASMIREEEDEDSAEYTPKPPSPPTSHQREKKRQQPKKRRSLFTRMLLGCCCVEDVEEEDPITEKQKEAELRSAAAAVVEDSFPTQPMKPRRKGGRDSHVAFDSAAPTPPLPMMYPTKKTPQSAMLKYGPVPTAMPPSKVTIAGQGMTPATPAPGDADDGEDVQLIDPRTLNKEQQSLLRLIPAHLTPKVTRRLQEELLKPFSEKDEPGYIYIFWLKDSPISPDTSPNPSPAGTPSKGTPSGEAPPKQQSLRPPAAPGALRTHSKAFYKAALKGEGATTPGGSKPKLLLKIGRANNVQRRLTEWTQQCGYNIQLVRYYPHTSASSSSGFRPGRSSPTVLTHQLGRKVPNVNRVERLIHLELSAANPKRQCDKCGRQHKEWFEIEASRAGILGVDELVKRWVEYAERSAASPVSGTGGRVDGSPNNSMAATSGSGKTPSPQSNKKSAPKKAEPARPKPARINAVPTVKMYEPVRPGAKPKPSGGRSKIPVKGQPKKQQSPQKKTKKSEPDDGNWTEDDDYYPSD